MIQEILVRDLRALYSYIILSKVYNKKEYYFIVNNDKRLTFDSVNN